LPSLHAQSVPPVQDIHRRVVVGVVPMPARGADEGRLVFAASFVHGPAGRAGLGRVGRIDLDQSSRLVEQHSLNLVPADVEDGAIQSTFLGDHLSRLGNRSGRRSRHVGRSQALNNYRSKAPANVGRRLVRPVLSGASLLGPERRNSPSCLGMTDGAALATVGDPLGFANLQIERSDIGRQAVASPVRQHQWNSYAAINADSGAIVLSVTVDQATEADLPSKGGLGDRYLTDAALNRAAHAELYPANFWQADAAPSGVDALSEDLTPVKTKSVSVAFSLEPRERAKASEKPLKCSVEILNGPLLRRLTNGSDKIEFSSKRCQFARLSHEVQVVACRPLILAPVVHALLKAQVPDQAAHPRELLELSSLIASLAKRVGETTEHIA